MIKTIISGLILSSALIGSAVADTMTLRYAEGAPNRGIRGNAAEHFIKEVKELSEGELDFEMHWSGVLLDYASVVKGVSQGTADMGTVIAGYNPRELQALSIGDVPVDYPDPWVGARAIYEIMNTNDELKKLLERQNLHYLTGYSSTGVQFECAGDAKILTVEDIEGKRIRAIANHAKVIDDLGGNLVNLSIAGVYQAMDTGLIDCAANYFYTIRGRKTYEVSSSVTIANWGQINGLATVINLDTWNDLNDKQKEALTEGSSRAIDYFAKLQVAEQKDVLEGLRTGSIGKKVPVYEMAEEERQKLLKASEKYAHAWIDNVSEAGVNGQKIWDEYEAILAKYQKELDTKGYPWER